MGIAYRSVPQLGLIVEVWDGVITGEQWSTHVEKYLGDPERLIQHRSLVDLTTADASNISAADEAKIMTKYAPHASELTHRKSAALAAREFEPSFAFATRIEQLGLKVIVFNDLAVACTWLGVAASDVQPVVQELRAALRADRNS
jgi:hypothetical protein